MPLRQYFRQKLAECKIEAAAPQIAKTHGANPAMDLILRSFVRSGRPLSWMTLVTSVAHNRDGD
jgi:DNA-binding transcriptional MocR family regulator